MLRAQISRLNVLMVGWMLQSRSNLKNDECHSDRDGGREDYRSQLKLGSPAAPVSRGLGRSGVGEPRLGALSGEDKPPPPHRLLRTQAPGGHLLPCTHVRLGFGLASTRRERRQAKQRQSLLLLKESQPRAWRVDS